MRGRWKYQRVIKAMALCTLVDQNDHVIGYKERDQLEAGDIYRITSLWVTNYKDEILLSQRVLTKKNDPGSWGPAVAGTVENRETYDENIAKEAREELGIAGVPFTRGPKLFVADNGRGQGYFCQTFIARLDWPIEKFTLQLEEVAAVKWVNTVALNQEIATYPERFVANFSVSCAAMVAFIQEYQVRRPGL